MEKAGGPNWPHGSKPSGPIPPRFFLRCYNAVMSVSDNQSPRASRVDWWGVWAVLGILSILGGGGNIYHGVKTIDWPFKVGWVTYLQIGRPQIAVGLLLILLGIAMIIRAVIQWRSRPA